MKTNVRFFLSPIIDHKSTEPAVARFVRLVHLYTVKVKRHSLLVSFDIYGVKVR
ncbi:MAG: hypothetical protein H0T64_07600 [Pyrinomonadaceae bacterium]|nr:hypothetical protein [Pyrinomonadaceae bacterium]MDQ3173010.1 hypothetical protein [Acidobacteriota bacterium]